jgi:hypothetical protein
MKLIKRHVKKCGAQRVSHDRNYTLFLNNIDSEGPSVEMRLLSEAGEA